MRATAVVASILIALVASACGDTGGEPTATTDTVVDRPPLDSPPDAGPVPVDDGLDADLRAAVIASTVRVAGVACGRT